MKILPLLSLLVLLTSGCYCKARYFGMKEERIAIANNWMLKPKLWDIRKCGISDTMDVGSILTIHKDFLSADSAENVAARIDSLVLQYPGFYHKKINERDFKSPVRPYELSDSKHLITLFSFLDEIPRNVKDVTLITYVSFKYPEDERIMSTKYEVNLYQKIDIHWVRWWVWTAHGF